MKIKLLTDTAQVPTRGSSFSAGYDLVADESLKIPVNNRAMISTGIAIALPTKHFGRIAPRSGLALKNGIDVLAGVIDEDYRGEVKVILYNSGDEDFTINKGDRIAQLIIQSYLAPVLEVTNTLDDTVRSEGGFGSTGIA